MRRLKRPPNTIDNRRIDMPKALKRKLTKSAKKAGLKKGSERFGAYVYGTMDKIEKAKAKKRR